MGINAPLLLKLNEYVKSMPSSIWNFNRRTAAYGDEKCKVCWLGLSAKIEHNLSHTDMRIPEKVYAALFGYSGYSRLYKAVHKDISKERVCNLVERYIKYKLRQEHKWKQYEFKHFGVAVTDKRGVTI